MNEGHLTYLASPEWAMSLRTELLPWIRQTADLGDHVLEIGPGPGLTTDLLLELGPEVTAVEIDTDLAARLRDRLPSVEVVQGNAITAELPDGQYSSVTCFSMLHHMESPDDQDRLFARLYSLLRPGAVLLGTDPLDTEFIREAHIGDTCVLVDPDTLADRLHAAGFVDASVVQAGEHQFRFTATRPGSAGLTPPNHLQIGSP
jgi:SAM-dependent methyltransferase